MPSLLQTVLQWRLLLGPVVDSGTKRLETQHRWEDIPKWGRKVRWQEVRLPGPHTQPSQSVTWWPWETSLGHSFLGFKICGWEKMTAMPLTYLCSETLKMSSKMIPWSSKGGRSAKPSFLWSALGQGCIRHTSQLGREGEQSGRALPRTQEQPPRG